ncbi:MAG: secondary thiamine-phosphate synthase enzyme YjbQ [Thermoplasmatales archaeon]|nr:secondary thiamine-phosphate synthase enzyme YjbQ [Thermoplasmatales archaeon]
MNYSETISFNTKGEIEIVNVTDNVARIVKKSGIKNGIGCVFVPGSTGAITTIEYEPGLLQDLPEALERLFPKNIEYRHHETWHDGNGHSHVRASVIGPGLTVPIKNGNLTLGTWQQIVFVELDVRKRKREIIVQIIGE